MRPDRPTRCARPESSRTGWFSCGPVRRVGRIIETALEPTLFAQLKAATMLQQLLLELHAENLELSIGGSSAFAALLVELRRTPERWWTVGEMAKECGLSESTSAGRFTHTPACRRSSTSTG